MEDVVHMCILGVCMAWGRGLEQEGRGAGEGKECGVPSHRTDEI